MILTFNVQVKKNEMKGKMQAAPISTIHNEGILHR